MIGLIDEAVGQLCPSTGTAAACEALGVPRAAYNRRHPSSPLPETPE